MKLQPQTALVNGVRIRYALAGPEKAPQLVFGNSLGTDCSMWQPQLEEVTREYRVLLYDTRGHGGSSVPDGPYNMDDLGNDLLGLLNFLSIKRVNFCGLSMGGMLGQWLGIHARERLNCLMLCNTAAKIGTPEVWNERIAQVMECGVKSIAPAVLERWFTPEFLKQQPGPEETVRGETVSRETFRGEKILHMLAHTSAVGYAACCSAIRDADFGNDLSSIRTRTLVVAGTRDPVTTVADGLLLCRAISGAKLVEIETAHLSNQEQPAIFTKILLDFLSSADRS